MLSINPCPFQEKADGATDVSVRQVVTLKAHPKNPANRCSSGKGHFFILRAENV